MRPPLQPALHHLPVHLLPELPRRQKGARLEHERERELLRRDRPAQHLPEKRHRTPRPAGHDVAAEEGVVEERRRLSDGVEDLVGVVEVAVAGDGVELGEAGGGVGVGVLGGLDHECVDLGGLAEVGAEAEEGDGGERRRWAAGGGCWTVGSGRRRRDHRRRQGSHRLVGDGRDEGDISLF